MKWRKHVRRLPKEGYKSRTVRAYFPSLKCVPNDSASFRQALSLVNRAYDTYLKKEEEGYDIEDESKVAYRAPGGGRKAAAPNIREALFEWFINVRGVLKGRLPRSLFKLKCEELFAKWKESSKEDVPPMKFSNHWIHSWMRQYNVSLLKPNKRFAINRQIRKQRILEFLKNIWRVRHFFNAHFRKEPVIINGDQMPLHRNESSSQKTLSLKGQQTFVKENYMLSRERVTVYTQVSTDPKYQPKPEFVFKGKGTKTKLQVPAGMHAQWAPKGSYRLENMLETIKHLPNLANPFSCKDYAVYVLDDYSVHITQEVRRALLARGYILVCIGGGITGDIQVNDTHIHHKLKSAYRSLETKLMLEKLEQDPSKVPSPNRDDMMRLVDQSWESLDVDTTSALKNNFILNDLMGSEDYLVTDKLFELVGVEMKAFRTELLAARKPGNLKDLLKRITPPQGVRIASNEPPLDEGLELLDCEGEEIDPAELEGSDLADDNSSDDEMPAPQVKVCSKEGLSEQTSTTADLSKLTVDASTNADAAFLDDLRDVLKKHSTSTSSLFLPHFCQLKACYARARSSVKKRITQALRSKVSLSATTAGSTDDTDKASEPMGLSKSQSESTSQSESMVESESLSAGSMAPSEHAEPMPDEM